MPENPLGEKVANALSRAQALTFTTFSAALLIGFVASINLADRESQKAELESELSSLTDIANRADNALREIRRYIYLRMPSESEGEAVRKITTAEVAARGYADQISHNLIGVATLDQILAINRLLIPLRTKVNATVSVNVDFSPEAIIVLSRLEQFRLRDLAVLTHLIAPDPVRLAGVLQPYAGLQGDQLKAVIDKIHTQLQSIADDTEKMLFDQMAVKGDELRDRVEDYSLGDKSLIIGGLASSYEETLNRVRILEERHRLLTSSLRGDFKIDVPFVGQAMPIRLVVGLFPIGLIAGYGLVCISLAYARAQINTLRTAHEKTAAANVGLMFDQLRAKDKVQQFLTWTSLTLLVGLPLVAASIVIYQYTSTLSTLNASVLWLLCLIAVGMALYAGRLAWDLSTFAKN